MGLVMADALAFAGLEVRLWGPFEADLEVLSRTRRSPRLPDFTLPENVEVLADAGRALDEAEFVISAIPTQFLREIWQRLGLYVQSSACIVSVSKGIEIGTMLRPTQVIRQAMSQKRSAGSERLVALSGPCIAAELARRLPASLVAAADLQSARRVQDLFRVPWLRVYRNDDMIGVEMAGATKNIIALAAGMIDGLQAGANAKS